MTADQTTRVDESCDKALERLGSWFSSVSGSVNVRQIRRDGESPGPSLQNGQTGSLMSTLALAGRYNNAVRSDSALGAAHVQMVASMHDSGRWTRTIRVTQPFQRLVLFFATASAISSPGHTLAEAWQDEARWCAATLAKDVDELRRSAARSGIDRDLNHTDRTILTLLSHGSSAIEVASRVGLSERSVYRRLGSIASSARVECSTTALVALALRRNWIE